MYRSARFAIYLAHISEIYTKKEEEKISLIMKSKWQSGRLSYSWPKEEGGGPIHFSLGKPKPTKVFGSGSICLVLGGSLASVDSKRAGCWSCGSSLVGFRLVSFVLFAGLELAPVQLICWESWWWPCALQYISLFNCVLLDWVHGIRLERVALYSLVKDGKDRLLVNWKSHVKWTQDAGKSPLDLVSLEPG